MIDYSKYAELQLVDFQAVSHLVKSGWVILDTVDVSVSVSLNRNEVVMPNGNNYPQSHAYIDQAVGVTRQAVLGKPIALVENKWRIEHDNLTIGLELAIKERGEANKRVEHVQLVAQLTSKELTVALAEKTVLTESLNAANSYLLARTTELRDIKVGMAQMVSKVGGATLAELSMQDQVEEEIKKAAAVGDAAVSY